MNTLNPPGTVQCNRKLLGLEQSVTQLVSINFLEIVIGGIILYVCIGLFLFVVVIMQ